MTISVTSLVGNGDKASASATLAVTLGATGVAVDEVVLVAVGADNAGTSGASSISSVTDSQSNTYSQIFTANRTAGSAANDGATVSLYAARAKKALVASTDTITANFSPNTTGRTLWVVKVANIGVTASSTNTATGSGTAYTSGGASASVPSGNLIVGAVANESGTVPANDTDTTNGSWSNASQASGGTGGDATKMAVGISWKVVTSAGAQTFNGATGANTDWAAGYAIFIETTMISPAAASLTASGQTPTTKTVLKPAAISAAVTGQTPSVAIVTRVAPSAASLTATRSTTSVIRILKPMQGNGGNGNAYQNYQTTKANGVTSVALNWAYDLPKAGRFYAAVTSQTVAYSGSETVTDNAGNTWVQQLAEGASGLYSVWVTSCENALPSGSTWTVTFDAGSSQNLMLGIVDFGTGFDPNVLGIFQSATSTTSTSATYATSFSGYSRAAFMSMAWIKKTTDNVITSYPSDMLYLSNSGATDLVNFEWGISNSTTPGVNVSRSWTLANGGTRWYYALYALPFVNGTERSTPTLANTLNPAAASLTATGQTPEITSGSTTKTVEPAAASLTASGQTPALAFTVPPASGSLALSGQTSTLTDAILPAAASLAVTGETPTLADSLRPSAAALTLDGQTPDVAITSVTTIEPGAASLTAAGQTPTLTDAIRPGAASLAATGQTPTAAIKLSPDAGSMSLSGQTPDVTVTLTTTIAPAAASLTASGQTATLTRIIRPAARALATAASTPKLSARCAPAAGSLTASGQTPLIKRTIRPVATSLATSLQTAKLYIIDRPATASLTITRSTPGVRVFTPVIITVTIDGTQLATVTGDGTQLLTFAVDGTMSATVSVDGTQSVGA